MNPARVVRWRVRGLVQGVGFRWFVQQRAMSLALDGDVHNLPDGQVEIRARGASDRLARLLEQVREGPQGARVEGVETLEPDADLPRDGFHIRVP